MSGLSVIRASKNERTRRGASQALLQMRLKAGVVQLGGGHRDPVQGLAIQRQSALHTVGADSGDLVRNRHMGVQVGIAGAANHDA